MSKLQLASPAAYGRVQGIDVARAIALMLMVFAHVTTPSGIAGQLLYGFPAATFAFLAGISLELMARRPVAAGGIKLARFRHSLYVRGALLIALFGLLQPFAGQIHVVLLAFGLCYFGLALTPSFTTRNLAWLLIALVGLSAGTAALATLKTLPTALGSPYPVFAWAALMVAGMLSWRLLFQHTVRTAVALAIGSVVAAIVVFARHKIETTGTIGTLHGALLAAVSPHGHVGGALGLLGEVGFAVALTSIALLLSKLTGIGSSLGRMPLTFYCAHVLFTGEHRGFAFAFFTIAVGLAFAMIWSSFYRRGPLEAALRYAAYQATRLDAPARPTANNPSSS